MKKLNTTYLDSLVSKILSETLEEKADNLISKIKGDVCECGGQMYEGECVECGSGYGSMEEGIYDVDDIDNSNEFDYVQEEEDIDDQSFDGNVKLDTEPNVQGCEYHIKHFGKDDPITQEICQGVNINEDLKGRQRKLDRNKNNKIDAEDFKMLRQGKKSETDEGNAFTGALSKARKSGDKDFEVGGKKFETKEGKEKRGTVSSFKRYCGGEITKSCIDKALNSGSTSLVKKAGFAKNNKKIKDSYQLSESELISMIEKIVLEQKVKDKDEKNNLKGVGGTPRGLEVYKKAHKGSGKENDDYIKDVTKKMKDYLKDGSKGDYDMNPKIFPKGNGELEKMDKKAYIPSSAVEEYTDNLTAAGQENLVYDEINPNEEWITDNIEGSSRTGNNPEWANTGESDVNKKRNKIRKDNLLGKIKQKAYNKSPQPIVTDNSGSDAGDKLMAKLESTTDKKQKQINEEFDRMKSLITYNQRTQ
jgi:hypothetical protein